MENHENIKNTNKALLVSNIILGCLLIIAMAFLAITIINNNNITASAAAENTYIKGELLWENTENTPMEWEENTADHNKYSFTHDYISLNENKSLILTIQIDDKIIDFPIYTTYGKASFKLNNMGVYGVWENNTKGKFEIYSYVENHNFIIKSIHAYPAGDYDIDNFNTEKEYVVKKNIASNLTATKINEEGYFKHYSVETQFDELENYDSLNNPPLII